MIKHIAWRYAITLVVLHALALLAVVPALFSWTALVLCLVGVSAYGTLGLDLAYHRLLTHRSLAVPRWLEHGLVLVGVCCFEDGPASWVAVHRRHHQSAEAPGVDPHSPRDGFWWSHVGWLLVRGEPLRSLDGLARYAPDVIEDRFYRRLQKSRSLLLVYLLHTLPYLALGYWLHGLSGAVGLVVWGVFVRTVLVWHISWSINSVTHCWGYRNYPTNDASRNNMLVALLSSGEGWHNNHHAQPTSATNWHRWWEFDQCYLFIRGLELIGLAWNVKRPAQELPL